MSVEEKIVELLSTHPEGLTIARISKELNIHRNTTSKYVFALVRSGIIEQRRVGVASLCYLKKKKGFTIGRKSIAKLSLVFLALIIILIFLFHYTIPITGSASRVFNFTELNGYRLELETEKQKFFSSELVKISGLLTFSNNPVENQSLFLTLISSDRIENQTVLTDSEGSFSSLLKLKEGNYTLIASSGELETSLNFEVIEAPFNLSLEKNCFKTNETVRIFVQGEAEKEFVLEIFGPIIENFTLKTNEEGSYTFERSFSIPGNYTARVLGSEVSFEVFEEKPEVNLKIEANETYWLEENISIEIEGSAETEFSLDIEKDEAKILSFFGKTNSSGLSEISFQVFEEGNYTARLNYEEKEDVAFFEVLKKNLTEAFEENVSVENVTENVSFLVVSVEQGKAEINKPVQWRKTIRVINPSDKDAEIDLPLELPENSFNLSLEEKETKRIFKLEEKRLKDKLKAKESKDYVLTYYTEAPVAKETVVNKYRKIVTISSSLHYENVLAYTEIEKAAKDAIKIYWLVDNERIDITSNESFKVNFLDLDNDNLIERVEWLVPYLSEQTFEISIVILNPYTYLRDNEVWVVAFNTTGKADLKISSPNANWAEMLKDNKETFDEMEFLDIKCGNNSLKDKLLLVDEFNNIYNYSQLTEEDSLKVKQLLIKDYSCEESGYISNRMAKAGYAILRFDFGGQVAYAYDPPYQQFNQTSSINITGIASTIDQATIDSYLNTNGDGLTWDITEIETTLAPLRNSTMGGDTGTNAWETSAVITQGTALYGYNTTGGNPAPSYFHKAVSGAAAGSAANITFYTNQSFYYDGSPAIVNLSWDYQILGNSFGTGNQLNIILYRPDGTSSILDSVTFSAAVDWTRRTINVNPANFTQAGTYVIQLKSTLVAALKGTSYYVQAQYDNVFLNFTKYQVSVEHNTTISYSGILNSINVSINFTSTVDDIFNMTIYNFANSNWDASPCQNISAIANNYYTIWCNVTASPTNYVSSDNKVRVRLNSTADYDQGTLREEYVQYYITTSVDTIPPTYSQNSTNSTLAGSAVSHNLFWQDNGGLSYAIFSFDNCTGSFQNITGMSLSGTSAWSNFTVIINSTVGCTIRWKVYANDTSNNWNESEIFSYTTSATPCQVYINSLPYNITQNNTYYCLNTSSTNLAGTAIQFGNSSSWVIQNSTLDCQGFNIDGDDTGTDYGIYLTGSETKNNTIKNCIITDFYYGIYLYSGPNNNTIINSTSNSNSYHGIFLSSSSSNSIINSTSNSNSNYGIYLSFSSNNSIINSTFNYNSFGINLDSSSNNTIINSILQENSKFDFYISASSDSECNNYLENIIGSGNRPIKYYNYSVNLANEVLSELILCNADNSNITNITIDASPSLNNNMLAVIRTDNSNFTQINSSYNYYGILLYYSSNNQIINSTFNSNSYGIYLSSSSNNQITGGSIASNTNQDYYLYSTGSTNNFTSTNFTAPRTIYFSDTTSWFNYNNRTDIELWLKTNVSAQATLTRNIFSWSKPIVKWQESSSSSITAYYNLTGLYPNSQYKIYNGSQLTYTLQTDSSGNLNFNLTIDSTSRNITVQYQNCEESIYSLPYNINKNNTYYCLESNLYIAGQTAITFASPIQNSTLDCLGFNLDGNDASNTYGIYLEGSETKNNTIKNCNITDFYYGISLYSSSNNSIINSTFNSNYYGIHLYSSSNNSIINSTSNSNSRGIYLYSSSNNNSIINSIANSNSNYGIYLSSSSNNNQIINSTLNSNSYGIYLYSSSNNNQIINSTSNSNFIGIYLSSSSNNSIINSTLNSNSYGILLSSSSNNNQIINSTFNFNYYGIYLSSSSNNNQIINSTLNSNSYGIYLSSSSNNTIYNNIIQKNTNYGIYLSSSGSTPNLIYNNLFNNTNNFYFEGDIYSNYWNTTKQLGSRIYSPGNYIGGNYWTNSTGNGFSDTCIDSNKDGFCDSPYILDPGQTGNNTDYLPLSNKYYPCQVFINSLPYNITQNNTYYCLNTSSTNLAGTAIQFGNSSSWVIQNSTLDCLGFNIDGDDTGTDYGIYLTGSETKNNTIKNCIITDFYYGIYLYSSPNNNSIINSTFNSNYYGIYLSSSSNNQITGGSIASNTNQDYYLYSTGSTNNFTSTNFTAPRTIYFSDTTSWFNYNNRTDIELWLKTNVSAQATLTRNIFSWSKPIVKWQESSSSSITAYYNLTGLYPNSQYKIYNGSQLTYTLQTDSSGNLNFNLTIDSTSRNITVQYQNCEESIYSLPYNINKNNTYYCLESNLYIAGQTAITFASPIQNSTLDCLGFNLDGNDASNTYGIYLEGSETKNNTIKNCNITDFYNGIYLNSSLNHTLENISATSNENIGIYIFKTNQTTIKYSQSSLSQDIGIFIESSTQVKVINVTINNNTLCTDWCFAGGMYVLDSIDIEIINVTSNYQDQGIMLDNTNNSKITGATTNFNTKCEGWCYECGIVLEGSYNNTIINSTSNSNSWYGISLGSSSNNQIINSTLQENLFDFFIYASSDSECNNYLENIIGSGNRPIKYYNYSVNLANEVLSELILCNADNSNITNITIDTSSSLKNNMLYVHRTDNSNFTQINSSYNLFGILLYSSSNNNQIINSTFNSNSIGIYLYYSSNNTIYNNIIQNNTNYGIYLYSSGSTPNKIYNNLFNNTNNFYFAGTIYSNYWNTTKQTGTRIYSAGTEIGGNYWTNPSGNGYSDTCTDANTDGFCDSYYELSATGPNRDYLPLSNKYSAGDTTPPTYSQNSTNSTLAGSAVSHNLFWQDNGGLSYAIFSFDNCTGSFQNITGMSLSGTSAWSNFTVIINSTVGCTIRWKVYANDTSNNWNESEIFSYTTSATPCQVYINSLPYNITQNNTYYCLNTSSTNLAGTAIQFGNSSSWVIQNSTLDCQGFKIDGSDASNTYGIYLTGSNTKNNTIKNCIITDFYYGIYLNQTNNNSIINSTSNSNSYGIRLYSSSSNSIINSTSYNNSYGIFLSSSSNNQIINSTLQENSYDFYISASSDSDCNNYLENIIGSGNRPIKYYNYSVNLANEVLSELILCNADYSNITNITIDASSSLKNNMLYVHRTDYSNFTQINSSYNYYGIYLYSSSNNSIINSTFNSNSDTGIFLSSSSNNSIINSTSNSNSWDGIYLSFSSNNTIINSIANSNSEGIRLSVDSNNNTIINSTSNSNSNYGIYLDSSSNNQIINSISNSNSWDGIYLYSSSNNSIINSTSNSNSDTGIYLDSSSNNQIINSTLQENLFDFFIYASSNSECNNYLENIIGSGNRPIKYYNYSVNLANEVLSELILCNADNSNITNITIDASSSLNNNMLYVHRTDYSNFTQINSSYNYFGILLDSSSNNSIINSTSNSNSYGILLDSSSNNSIINSTSNSNSYGIYLYSSSNNSIINSTFNSNSDTGIYLDYSSNNNQIINSIANSNSNYGIFLYSSSNNNQIINSTANSNSYGIYFYSSSNNTIYNNIIQNNTNYGIYLYSSGSTPNKIYNNLFNNTNNFYFAGTIYSNYWNTTKQLGSRIYSPGNYIGGNYWTNSTGNGFSDTCTDSDKDGFCDSPYTLSSTGQNIDYLPLSNQADVIPPQYSFNSTNSTLAGTTVSHNLFWQDNVNLSYAIFSFDNCTGSFQNISEMSLSGTSAWSNFTVVINSTVGCTIRWKVYANDTSNNWNASEIFSYTTTSAIPCQVYINSLPYTITQNNTYYCLESDLYIGGKTAISFANPIQNSTLDCLGYNIDSNKTSNTYGIYLTGSNTKNNTIKNCIITDFYYGIYLNNGPNNNSIINSTSNSNSDTGIRLYSSSNNTIINSTSNSNSDYGIYLSSSSNNQIISSTFNGNVEGIWLDSSSNNSIINSTSNSNSDYGIFLDSSSNNQIISSTANSNYDGIRLYSSSNNTIINSTLQENSEFDFYIYASSDSECNNYLENIIGSNNLPIKYYNYSVNLANEVLSELILCNADYSNITNITIDASPSLNNNMLYVYRTDNSNFTQINSSYNYCGIYLSSSSNNSIINSTSNSNSIGISLLSSSNNTIINSTFNYNSYYGIYLYSSSNNNQIINSTFNSNSDTGIYLSSSSNNTIINSTSNSNSDYGIYLYSSSDNRITGGSIASNTNQDYYLRKAGSTNNFTSTNFTAPRTIYFYDSSSWFNYNNRTDLELWLKTSVSTSATITRKLISWTQSLIQWNDTNSSGTEITARYNITGLNPNKYYLVYNNSVLTYILQADSYGNLPSFTIYLSGEKEIKVKQEEAPQWSNNKTSPSSPTVYQPAKSYQFNITCTDDTGIFNAWLTLNGTNYYMSNQSSEFYKTLTDLPAGNYFFNFTCNDTYGITNTTDTWLYTIEKAKPILTISNFSFSINTSGLVGYWRFEEGSGSTAKDSSGYGNDGILYNNPIWTEGMFGKALSFNGSNYVEIPNSSVFNITEEMSVEAWFYAEQNQPTGGSNQIIQRLDWSNNKGFFLREGYQSNHEVAFYVANGTNWTFVSYSVSPEKWYHVIGSVKSNDKIKLYVNGSLVAEYPFVGNIVQETNKNIRIGYEFSGAAFNGTIDEVKIWNRSLTQDEIEMLYQSEVTYKTQTNFSCSANTNQVSVNLYRNTTSVSNPDVQNLTAGYYYYLCNASETQNFTQSALLAPLKVNPGTISLTISPELTKGIFYTNLTGSLLNVQYNVEVNKWNNATWNYNASSQKTEYWIKNDGTFPIDICQKANSNMVCQDPWCGSYEIYIGNVSWSNSTLNDASNPSFSTLYPLTLDYSGNKSAYNLEPGSTIYLRFWFFVPSYVPSGKYNTSIVFKAVEAGNPC